MRCPRVAKKSRKRCLVSWPVTGWSLSGGLNSMIAFRGLRRVIGAEARRHGGNEAGISPLRRRDAEVTQRGEEIVGGIGQTGGVRSGCGLREVSCLPGGNAEEAEDAEGRGVIGGLGIRFLSGGVRFGGAAGFLRERSHFRSVRPLARRRPSGGWKVAVV